jgi:hypothetical protein
VTRTDTLSRMLVVLFVVGILAGACGSSDDGSAAATLVSSTQSSETSEPDVEAPILPGEPLVDGIPQVTLLGPGSADADEYPLFRWEAVPGAGLYQLVVSDSSGPIWAWEGLELEVRLGAVDDKPPTDYGGPSLVGASCWSVTALNDARHVVAASELVPVSPGSEAALACSVGG